MNRLIFLPLVLAAVVAASVAGRADAQEIDVENFHPVSPGDGELFSVQSARQAPSGELAFGMSLDLMDDPLVVVDSSSPDSRVADVVGTRFGADLAAAYGLGRIELGAVLPLVLAQSSEANDMVVGQAESSGMGDVRLVARGRLLGSAREGFSLAAAAALGLPTAMNAEMAGDDGPSATPVLIAEWRMPGYVVAANAGARIRNEEQIGDLPVGSAFIYSLGGAWVIPPLPELSAVGEVGGEIAGSRPEQAPFEARAGARYRYSPAISISAGYGRGLIHGYGAPDHRFLVNVGYRPKDPPPDNRVTVRLPPPDPDPDGDGIFGDAEKCPEEAEDFDGYEDEDGCPEPDNDGDGIADADDRCAVVPEDLDGFNDEDGCPEPDNDFDGLADAEDDCPDEAEVINGVKDDDGCPDEGKQLVRVGEKKIIIEDKVYFAHDSADILPRSNSLLDQLAKTLSRNPWLKKITIGGHTDSRGDDTYNEDLSRRRAESVRKALTARGVDGSRLQAIGYGETQPIDNNKTVEGRANNRRVEFVIDEQEARPGTIEGGVLKEKKKEAEGEKAKGGAAERSTVEGKGEVNLGAKGDAEVQTEKNKTEDKEKKPKKKTDAPGQDAAKGGNR